MKSILIVDDNEANITILLNVLRSEYDLSVALNGEDALEIIKEELPDLILLDIVMEGISGIEVCEQIKSDDKTKHIPVIFLTATDETLKEAVYRAGADDLMPKPFNIAMLRARIKSLLEG